MANPELLLNKLAEDQSVLHNLFTGACEMENDLTLVGRLLEAVEKMIKWDRDFQSPEEKCFQSLIETSGGFDFLEQMK